MIQFTFDGGVTIEQVEQMLGSLSSEAKPTMKRALNQVSKDARKKLIAEAQKQYVIKAAGYKKNSKIKNATNSNLEATIKVTGKANELKAFKVSPASVRTGAARPDIVKGKVLKTSGMKRLEKGSIKAFLVSFASGHVTVAQRVGAARLPIKTLYSPSDPTMIGAKRVYGVLKPQIGEMLQQAVRDQVAKTLARG